MRFPREERAGGFVTLASGMDGDSNALRINAAARVMGATLAAGEQAEVNLDPGRHAYLVAVNGAVEVNGKRAEPRDGVAITGEERVTIRALDDAEIVLVDAR
jgi:hypothetical protein